MIILNNRKPKPKQERHPRARHHVPLTPIRRAAILDALRGGMSPDEARKHFHASQVTIVRIRREAGMAIEGNAQDKANVHYDRIAPVLKRINALPDGAEKVGLQMRLAAFHRGELPWADVDPADGISARRLGEVA